MTVGLVVPCFNEESRWRADYWTEVLALPGLTVLFVNDGSTDQTARLADDAVEGTPSAVLHLLRNGGKAEAVRQGLLALLDRGDCTAVGYLDADGAFSAADIMDMITVYGIRVEQGAFEAVWSSRVALAGRDIQRSGSRHYIGRIVATLVSAGHGQMPYDTQSGYKLFAPDDRIRACLETPFRTRWLFELELLARWQSRNPAALRVWEEPLNYWHDVPGSKIKGMETVRILRELAVVKQEQRRRGR